MNDQDMQSVDAFERQSAGASAIWNNGVAPPSPSQHRQPMSPSSSHFWSPSKSRGSNVSYSDRFIPSRAVSGRLDFSMLDREAATSEVTRIASGREVRLLNALVPSLGCILKPNKVAKQHHMMSHAHDPVLAAVF